MDMAALTTLLQALEHRQETEERQRVERYMALIERVGLGNAQQAPAIPDHPATASAVSRSMDILYRVHDGEKLGLAQVPNLALLSYATTCPNKQCWVSEVILKHAYSASDFAARLGNYNSILVAYQYHLLRSLYENHRPSPQQLDELRLVKKNLLCVSKLNGQAVVDEMLQRSHHARESTKELVRLLPKRPPPVTLGPSSLKDRHCQSVRVLQFTQCWESTFA
ncbi:UNVERIFIED_CONTAM: hypothetical protein FKN15_022018 [Acipenser sinensis]